MGRIQKVSIRVVFILLFVLMGEMAFGAVEAVDGLGFPKGIMDWSANGSISYLPYENLIVQPELLFNESFAWNKLKGVRGSVSMLTTSAYLLGRYNLALGKSGFSIYLSAGPGIHAISSLASQGSPALSASNTDISIKGHIIGGLRYNITDRQFLSLSIRSTFPNDSPLDCGYLSYGRSLVKANQSYAPNTGRLISIARVGLNSTKDNYTIYSVSGIVGKRLGNKFSMGLGAGWDCAKDVLAVPFFLDLRLYLKEFGESFYGIADGGYSIAWLQGDNSFSKNGFAAFVGVGYSMSYAGNNAVNFELGVKSEKLSETTSQYENNNYHGPLPPPPDIIHHGSETAISGVAQIGFQFGL